jgi:hypothetical protein
MTKEELELIEAWLKENKAEIIPAAHGIGKINGMAIRHLNYGKTKEWKSTVKDLTKTIIIEEEYEEL